MFNLKLFLSEIRYKTKEFLIWTIAWSLMGILQASVFNNFAEESESLTQLFDSFPAEILDAFNIGVEYFTTIEGLLGGEFLTLMLLGSGIYASLFGVRLIGGKIRSGTIINFLSKNISRSSFYLNQLWVGITYFTLSLTGIASIVYMFIDFWVNDNLQLSYWLALFVGVWIINIFFLVFGMLLGIILGKGLADGLAGGLAGITWFLDILSGFDSIPDWVKYLTPYSAFDADFLVTNYDQRWASLSLVIGISILISTTTIYFFRKKDVYL